MFTITDKAISELKEILNGPQMPENAAIRVFANSSGCCSGNQLGIEIADLAQQSVETKDFDGLKILMDEATDVVAQNATIDFYEHAENPGFRVLWQKQQEHGSCGCDS